MKTMKNTLKQMAMAVLAFGFLVVPWVSHADTNPLLDFKGRLKWVAADSLASYRAVLSDNFTDASTTTTTEQPATTTTVLEPTTTLVSPTTTILSPTTTLDGGGGDDDGCDDDHDSYRDDDCEDDDDHDRAALPLTFSAETTNGASALFDFRCDLVTKGNGKYKCKLPGVKVKIRPYKTPGTHRVKVRYTNDIPKPLDGQIKVIMLSEVFGRVPFEAKWADAPNGYKVRGH